MLDCVKVAAYSLCESKLGNLVKSGTEEYGGSKFRYHLRHFRIDSLIPATA